MRDDIMVEPISSSSVVRLLKFVNSRHAIIIIVLEISYWNKSQRGAGLSSIATN